MWDGFGAEFFVDQVYEQIGWKRWRLIEIPRELRQACLISGEYERLQDFSVAPLIDAETVAGKEENALLGHLEVDGNNEIVDGAEDGYDDPEQQPAQNNRHRRYDH